MLERISKFILSLFPDGFNPQDMLTTLGFIIAIVFIAAVLIRIVHQKASGYNHALASAMAIMFTYLLLVVLHGVVPSLTGPALKILPLVEFNGDSVALVPLSLERFSDFCAEYLHVFILVFILIALDDMIPDAKNAPSWIILQFVIASMALVGYYIVLKCIDTFAPNLLDSSAPMILVSILLFMIFLGLLKVVFSLMLVAVSPLLGAVSAFFSTSNLGQALGKAVLSSLVLVAVSVYLQSLGLGAIPMSDLNLLVCAVPMAVVMGLWFVVGFVL